MDCCFLTDNVPEVCCCSNREEERCRWLLEEDMPCVGEVNVDGTESKLNRGCCKQSWEAARWMGGEEQRGVEVSIEW